MRARHLFLLTLAAACVAATAACDDGEGDRGEVRQNHRQAVSKPQVERYFAWCRPKLGQALENTPLRYSLNQVTALGLDLEDGRLPA